MSFNASEVFLIRIVLNVNWRDHISNIDLYRDLPKVSDKVTWTEETRACRPLSKARGAPCSPSCLMRVYGSQPTTSAVQEDPQWHLWKPSRGMSGRPTLPSLPPAWHAANHDHCASRRAAWLRLPLLVSLDKTVFNLRIGFWWRSIKHAVGQIQNVNKRWLILAQRTTNILNH